MKRVSALFICGAALSCSLYPDEEQYLNIKQVGDYTLVDYVEAHPLDFCFSYDERMGYYIVHSCDEHTTSTDLVEGTTHSNEVSVGR